MNQKARASGRSTQQAASASPSLRDTLVCHVNSYQKNLAMMFFVFSPFFVPVIVLPYLVHVGLIEWYDVKVASALYVIAGLGITVMYHRYLTHRSFTLPKWAEAIGLWCAQIALQSGPTSWVATHTKHHACADEEGDPHSPHKFGEGLWNMLKGFYWAHCGWIIKGVDVEAIYIPPHLKEDKIVAFYDRTFPIWAVSSYLIPAAAGWMDRGLEGAIVGFLIGGVLRIFFGHHVTWSVNSLGHMIGDKPFIPIKNDQSRNLPLVYPVRQWLNPIKLVSSILGYLLAIFGFGEPYHAGHHAIARSAKHAIGYRWHVDISWYVILILKALGIAKNVYEPTHAQIQAQLKGA